MEYIYYNDKTRKQFDRPERTTLDRIAKKYPDLAILPPSWPVKSWQVSVGYLPDYAEADWEKRYTSNIGRTLSEAAGYVAKRLLD